MDATASTDASSRDKSPEYQVLKLGITDERFLIAFAADCAERALPFWERRFPDDDRPAQAIEWVHGWLSPGGTRLDRVRAEGACAEADMASLDSYGQHQSINRAATEAAAAAGLLLKSPLWAIGSSIEAQIQSATFRYEGPKRGKIESDWQKQHLIRMLLTPE